MPSDRYATKESLLAAAAVLLERGGPCAVTTRAVLSEAGLTAPTLYHHFGDKDGLLDALLEDGTARFFAHKAALAVSADPLEDLIQGWEWFLDFVCEQPQLFRLLTARALEDSDLLNEAMDWTRSRLEQLEVAGRLTQDVSFGVQTLMSVSLGVAMLRAQGASDTEVRRVAHFMYTQSLAALVRTE